MSVVWYRVGNLPAIRLLLSLIWRLIARSYRATRILLSTVRPDTDEIAPMLLVPVVNTWGLAPRTKNKNTGYKDSSGALSVRTPQESRKFLRSPIPLFTPFRQSPQQFTIWVNAVPAHVERQGPLLFGPTLVLHTWSYGVYQGSRTLLIGRSYYTPYIHHVDAVFVRGMDPSVAKGRSFFDQA